MAYPDAAWERTMTRQEVMLNALSGELHWFRAAEILGWSPRTLRRWRERYEVSGYSGLLDKRLHRPSIRRVPPGQVEQVRRLCRERYAGFNVRHFHEIARREHGVTMSYSFVKQALQTAGVVKKHRARGRYRRRREPSACFGELKALAVEDYYMTEGGWHVRERNDAYGRGDFTTAWKENRILEQYYTPFLDVVSFIGNQPHRWPPEQRAEAEDRKDEAWPFTSAALSDRVAVRPSKTQFWVVASMIALAPWILPALRRSQPGPPRLAPSVD